MGTIARDEALALLNAPERLDNLKKLMEDTQTGRLDRPVTREDVNNHIHTQYSFSPYSPTAAVWFSYQAGLCTCGLMDHDSIAGADEFLSALQIVGMPGTIGLECRVSMANTPFEGRRINNPDQSSIAYIALHGVPRNRAGELNAFFAPYRERRNVRNRKMVDRINALMSPYGVAVDFETDVLPLSKYDEGGSVTERHVCMALAGKLIDGVGDGAPLVAFIRNTLKLPLSEKIEGYLLDRDNPHRMYDLLGWIKAELIRMFYVDATDECPGVHEAVAFAESIGAIPTLPYLGDVVDSVTGDKRAQTFEDDFLDEWISYMKGIGFRAVAYMPSRNTRRQLDRLRALCVQYDLFQISGEDINSSRQPFVCMAQREAEYRNLFYSTWALIAHEERATINPADGFFSEESMAKWPELNERILAFARFGMQKHGFDECTGGQNA